MKTKRGKMRGRFLKKTLIAVLLFLVLLSLLLLAAGVYFYQSTDFSMDEELFYLAKGSKTTRIYYNENGGAETPLFGKLSALDPYLIDDQTSLNGYVPKEMEDQRIHGADNGIWCAYEDIPQHLKDAFVAIEDQRYFSHNGVDWLRTTKAALNYFLHFDGRFGGSTITQQLIKNVSSDNELTIARKIREACRAIHLERKHSKEEILELYLNIVPLSSGCVGVGAAAKVYYNKDIKDLTLAECAAIAAVTNSPARYDPVTQAEGNAHRRNIILRKMHELSFIDDASLACALAEDTRVSSLVPKNKATYNWYTETVIADVIADLVRDRGMSYEAAEKILYNGGLQIYTLMDYEVQEVLEEYFSDWAHFPREINNGLRLSMCVVDPSNGALLGVVGGVGEKKENRVLNYATQAVRAPGSALKPLAVYGPALEEGVITWADVYDDTPLLFTQSGTDFTVWPHNSPMLYGGLTDIPDAVSFSKNTVAVRVLRDLGKECSYSYLGKLGFSTLVRARITEKGETVSDMGEAPLALGQLTDGVSVRTLTNAYGALANGGNYQKSRSYALVLDKDGRVLLENKEEGKRVFSEETAAIMTELLTGVTNYGTAQTLVLPRLIDTAGKTGTSGEARDKWFVGYTPYMVAGIWCGNEDGTAAVPANASQTHLKVWDAVMQRLHESCIRAEEAKDFRMPHGIVKRLYCKDSGLLPCAACQKDPRGGRIVVGYFRRGSEPTEICNRHILVDYDVVSGGVACEDCPRACVEKVGLLSNICREFPTEVYVEDAQYVYGGIPPKEGVYEGVSRDSEESAFHRPCPMHGEGAEEDIGDPFGRLRRYFVKHFVKST